MQYSYKLESRNTLQNNILIPSLVLAIFIPMTIIYVQTIRAFTSHGYYIYTEADGYYRILQIHDSSLHVWIHEPDEPPLQYITALPLEQSQTHPNTYSRHQLGGKPRLLEYTYEVSFRRLTITDEDGQVTYLQRIYNPFTIMDLPRPNSNEFSKQ